MFGRTFILRLQGKELKKVERDKIQFKKFLTIRQVSEYGSKKVVFFIIVFLLIMKELICQSDSTIPNGRHEENPRVVVTHIANADNASTLHSDPHYGGLQVCFWLQIFIPSYKYNQKYKKSICIKFNVSKILRIIELSFKI